MIKEENSASNDTSKMVKSHLEVTFDKITFDKITFDQMIFITLDAESLLLFISVIKK